uniref:Uncharacterized protein n=2 Tax=Astyanax mexicanus TaxID=7994 RepID=A0A3B1J3K7_ASTMX
MVPFSIIDLLVHSLGLGGARAHVQQEIEVSVQHLNGKEVHLHGLGAFGVFLLLLLGFAVAEEQQAVGFGGAEVEGDGTGLLRRPLAERDERFGGLEGDRVQGGHVLTLESHDSAHFHLGITLFGQARQLQPHVVVLVYNLDVREENKYTADQ